MVIYVFTIDARQGQAGRRLRPMLEHRSMMPTVHERVWVSEKALKACEKSLKVTENKYSKKAYQMTQNNENCPAVVLNLRRLVASSERWARRASSAVVFSAVGHSAHTAKPTLPERLQKKRADTHRQSWNVTWNQ